jgi:hypothetical protein
VMTQKTTSDSFARPLCASLCAFSTPLRVLPGSVFIDDWDLYHGMEGETHCGTNSKRRIPGTPWWTA